jgi:hypothetical protein
VNCVLCAEPIDAGDVDYSWRSTGNPAHGACMALGIVGHDYGVCTCTGYDTQSRAAAIELWQRMGARREHLHGGDIKRVIRDNHSA